jgi:hypothetical protein
MPDDADGACRDRLDFPPRPRTRQADYTMNAVTFRKCHDCGRRIELCNGFASARYCLLALYGVIPWVLVRELCGRCVEKVESLNG